VATNLTAAEAARIAVALEIAEAELIKSLDALTAVRDELKRGEANA
jgi:hypothetical protein